jgi:hypothetical protein
VSLKYGDYARSESIDVRIDVYGRVERDGERGEIWKPVMRVAASMLEI